MAKQPKKKTDVDLLAEAMEGSPRQQAEGIADFVEGRLKPLRQSISNSRKEISQLVAQQGGVEGDLTTETREAAAKVIEADKAAKQATSPTDVADVADKADEAEKAVVVAKRSLEERMAIAEGRLKSHGERISALEVSQKQTASVAARALAIARVGGGGTIITAARVALMITAALAVAYALIWGLSPLNWQLMPQVVVPLAIGALAGWAIILWGSGNDSHAEAHAEAEVGHGAHGGNLDAILDSQSGVRADAHASAH